MKLQIKDMTGLTYYLIWGKRIYRKIMDSGYIYNIVIFNRNAENIVLPLILIAAEESNIKTPVSAKETNKAWIVYAINIK